MNLHLDSEILCGGESGGSGGVPVDHASKTDLILSRALKPADVFTTARAEALVAAVEDEIKKTIIDASSRAGRDSIKSLAHKISRSKTALDDMGAELVAEWKAQSAEVDAIRRNIRTRMDALRAWVRAPLDAFEAAEAARVKSHEDEIQKIVRMVDLPQYPAVALVRQRLEGLLNLGPRDWQEFADRAAKKTSEVRAFLEKSLEMAVEREAERAELEKLREEREERDARERADRERAIVEERQRLEAQARAQREEQIRREAEARVRKEAERRAEADKLESERRVREADEARLRAEERAAADRRRAQELEDARIAAEEAAARRVEEERKRAEAHAEAERDRKVREEVAAAVVRKSDEEARVSRGKIRQQIRDALVAGVVNLTRAQADLIVAQVDQGLIPRLRIDYGGAGKASK